MDAVSVIFDFSQTLLSTFSFIGNWFITPVSYDALYYWVSGLGGAGGILGGFIIDLFVDLESFFGTGSSDFTPIYLIMGPGLIVYLSIVLYKWIKGVIPLFG